MTHTWWIGALTCVGASLGAIRPCMAQQPTGTITGLVTDADSHAPLPNVGVVVLGTNRASRTTDDGHFRIVNVPAGNQQVRAIRLGYSPLTEPVTVTENGTADMTFVLHTTSVTLSAVVITGTATQTQQARENGSSIGVLPLDSINPAPITTISDVLNARVAGLTVQNLSGTIGTASRIVIRGEATQSLQDQPLIVIDGVRAYNDINGFSDLGGVGGQSISRFDDLDKESIENVQVLKGASAAALYGTEAAAGVIVITTRQGEVGSAPKWHLFGNLGGISNYVDYPANYGRGSPSAPLSSCSLVAQFGGFCTASPTAPIYSFNAVQNSQTLSTGYSEGTGLDVSGGSPAVTYYLGANWSREQGVIQDNADRWTHLNGTFNTHPYSILDLSANISYTQRRTLLPIGDNGIGGVFTADLLAPGAGPGLYFGGLTPQEAEQAPNNENVDRFTLGSTGNLRVLPWLSLKGTAGVDYLSLYDSFFYSQVVLPPVVTATGNAGAANNSIFQYTGSASATANYNILPSLKGTSAIGGEWDDYTLRQTFGTGQSLLPGTSSLAGATNNFATGEVNQDIVDIGGYLSQSFAWRDRLYLTLAGRVDGNSAFGTSNSTAFYPSANASYVISDEAFWPKNDIISSLRFRAAGGQTGVQPQFRQATGTFLGSAYNVFNGGSIPALIPNTYANPNLKPERSTEYEGGFDLGFLKDRLTFSATAYDKAEKNLVQEIPIDISTGVGAGPPPTAVFSNLGSIDNRGLEFSVNGTPYTSDIVSVDLGVNLYINRNKLSNLGKSAADVISSGVTGNRLQLDTTGFPLGGFFALPYTYADKHHNGIISPDDITFGSTPVYVGEQGPREEFSFSPTVTVFRYLRVNVLFDRRDGMTVYDGTDAFRCLYPFQEGRECNDPKAPLKEQAAAIAQNGELYGLPQSDYGYLLNGSFWKWRELSVTLVSPQSWVRRFLRGHTAQFTISGRNLGTWSNYRGLDPELNEFGGAFNPAASQQFFEQPPLRFWTGRIDFSW